MRSLRDGFRLAEHQLDAVERLQPMLETCGGAILADEPGLGKSFVAAELARREERSGGAVELIVPASLVQQWRETLRRFSSAARVLTHASLLAAPAEAPRRRLVIVDEAHAFRNPLTQRFAALARRSAGARLLLVTATPVCNGPRDLETLLRLIVCDDALAAEGVPSIDAAFELRDREAIAAIVSKFVVRRDRSALPPSLAFGALDRRVIRAPPLDPVVTSKLAALRFPLVGGEPLVRDFLQRRLESSEAALLESLRRQRRFYERALECLSAGRALPKRDYRRAFAHEEDAEAFQTILFWELFVPDSVAADPAEIGAAVDAIDELRRIVEQLPRMKERALVDLCSALREPLLIFTGWTATAISLVEALSAVRPTLLVTGRERANGAAIEAFRRGAADILVSTDVGAEGLNLQRAGVVIHYDLPWNPVRLDQRNGRAHRIGQRRDAVRAIYFLPERHRVLPVVARKNRDRRQLLQAREQMPPHAAGAAAIRPRVANSAAIVRFAEAARQQGWRVPAELERRHRAGVEAALAAAGAGTIDEDCIAELEALLALEPWSVSRRACRFTPL